MKLDNAFDVRLPVDRAWTLLLDLPRIAPCLPGAHLDDVVDGEYRGGLSTKIGPINARYTGTARFLERDEVAHRAVIRASGREAKGSGVAAATITATLRPSDAGTRVELSTDMAISGRAAQFGRNLMAEVSSTLIDEFARRLEVEIGRAGAPPAGTGPVPTASPTGDTLDVGRTVLVPLLRRAVVPVITAAVGVVIGVFIGRCATVTARE
jgi:carbon monoxide dehydrogenase subunit G